MSQEQHNFLDELGLGRVIDYIKTKFASLSHSHKLSEITDYTVDSAMSSTSTNPVQNKVINSALSGKVPTSRTINGKKLSSNITLSASDVGAATADDISTAKNEVQTNLDTHIDNADIHFSATERTKLSGIAEGAQKNTVTGVKGSSESTYRTGNINITKDNIGLSNVNNTSDANKPVSTAQQAALDGHNTNVSAHNDIRLLIEDVNTKLMNFLDLGTDESAGKEVIDSVSELVSLYEENADLINSITTSKVNVSDIVNNLTTASTSKVLSANQGVEIKKLIDALQTAVNGKSDSGHTHDGRYYTESEVDTKLSGKANTSHGNHVPTTETANNAKFLRNDNTWQTVTPENIGAAKSSHGTHVSYSTTAPVMDGTASVGSASTVARSDHKHPTDTSRVSKTEFDSHTSDTTKHITSTERTNWNSAKTHADSVHAPSNAQANQNAFSNIKVGDTTISADTTTDTLTLVGSNVTITPDATNDKVTIAVASGSTSAKGIVQLTNSTSSTSTTTAATPNSVKSAYDLANTAKTNAATAQTRADSAYSLAESKVDSLSDLGITATATELNKLDGVTVTASELNFINGVTSNIQSQLDNKVNEKGVINVIRKPTSDGYLKFAEVSLDTGYGNKYVVLFISSEYNSGGDVVGNGIVYINIRGNGTSASSVSNFFWLLRNDAMIESLYYAVNDHKIEFYRKAKSDEYSQVSFKILNIGNFERGSNWDFKLINVPFIEGTPLDTPIGVVNKISSGGRVSIADTATSATKATQDSNGNTITSTYATKNELNSAKTNLQTSIDSKQATITGGASTITGSNLTANRALISNGSGKVAVSAVTSTELGYLDGVTSNIQTQLDGKSGTGHTHNYAGSSSAGGSANSAVKLTTSAGSATKPVYFSDGKPVACTYELKKTVPSDAVFTDTKYTHPTTSGNKHIPSGGSSGQILRWSANGTAVWGNDKAIYKKNLITLPTTGWVGDYAPYTINISIEGVLENSDVQITPMLEMTLEQLDAWENLRLYAGKTYDGYITLKANGFKPSVEIPLEVLIGAEIVE